MLKIFKIVPPSLFTEKNSIPCGCEIKQNQIQILQQLLYLVCKLIYQNYYYSYGDGNGNYNGYRYGYGNGNVNGNCISNGKVNGNGLSMVIVMNIW